MTENRGAIRAGMSDSGRGNQTHGARGFAMTNDWIIDVLTDLGRVAAKNGLRVTAAELKDLCLVAMAEIAASGGPEGSDRGSGEPVSGAPGCGLLGRDVA